MKGGARLGIRIVVAAALAGLAVLAWRHYASPRPIPVVLAAVARGTVEATVANTRAGTVNACRRSRLAPAVGGQVAQLSVREGDRVAGGQQLLVTWNDDLQARLQVAASEVLAADARVKEACLNAEVAEREADRQQRLGAQNLVAVETVDRATTEAQARGAACDAARAAHSVARARVDAARADVERTVLRAPFDGVVAEVNAEVGEFVTPSPTGIPTPPAVDLIDFRCVYVTAPIDEVDAPAIRTDMPACVTLDAFPGERRCAAHVRRIAPYVLDVEKQARTVEVEVALESEDARRGLLPGYTADVEIVLERKRGVLRVPTVAVLDGSRVLVFRESDGVLESRRFEPGLSNWHHTEVVSGLDEGERVVVSVDREGVDAGAAAMPEGEPDPRGAPGG